MITWTTEDREVMEKGLEFFKQLKGEQSPPHIVDSGASVMPNGMTCEKCAEPFNAAMSSCGTGTTFSIHRCPKCSHEHIVEKDYSTKDILK